MKPMKMVAAGCLYLSISGCSSVMSRTGSDQGYYAGTQANMNMMTSKDTSWVMMPLLMVDLPLTALMDTALLPYDYLRSGNDKTTDSLKTRIQQDEEKNQALSGNPGQEITPSSIN